MQSKLTERSSCIGNGIKYKIKYKESISTEIKYLIATFKKSQNYELKKISNMKSIPTSNNYEAFVKIN